jgi:predicted SprT family Zn-dependent metalloprotease
VTRGEARALASALMARHGLDEWRFGFDRARRRLGACHYAGRRITLSGPLVELNDRATVRDTVLHEIAHALTPGAGHGPAWRAACRRVGARPTRCVPEHEVTLPPAPYALVCERCGSRFPRYRRGRATYLCGHCRPAHGERAVLRWESARESGRGGTPSGRAAGASR